MIIFCEDFVGFVFELNRGIKYIFNVEIFLGFEFVVGWMGKRGKWFVLKVEV